MKKALSLLLIALLALGLLAGCGAGGQDGGKDGAQTPGEPAEGEETENEAGEGQLQVIKVGASITPHAEILAQIKDDLKAQGYDLQIVEFTDYVLPNLSLDEGDLDANYFQHQPYLDQFNAERGTKLVSIAAIHYEPYGIYPGKTAALEALADGAQISVPNDSTNEARALLLLEAQGLITLKENAGLNATVADIVENPKNLKIVEIEAAQLARSLEDVDMAVINGNYAIQAGLNVSKDAVATEDKDSMAAETFANILAVREGDENREDLQALAAALKSDKVKQYIENTYEGAVVPKF
ncbi:MAG: MetQ/NlpA family ABC transporter substrate-binding protein [Peptococcaceae bacterium]|nr:MetQ/NlpA family ABC transporter substrate-binding protein [Peptococcaceae bacterium]